MSLRIEQSVNIARPLRVEMEVQMAVIDKPIPVEQLTVAPSTATVEYSPSSGYYFDKVTANAVTSEIDGNIQPLNIREGVTILGVEGNLAPSGGGGDDELLTAIISRGSYTKYMVIPDSVTNIGNNAFSGCSGFTGSLVIPNSVTSIDNNAFRDCIGFTGDLTIPNKVTNISAYAFYGCIGFTGIILPNSVTNISAFAFYGCIGFTGIILPNSVTIIGGSAFNSCIGFTGDLTIPNSVKNIGATAFNDCSNLTRVVFDGEAPIIQASAFSGCTKILEYDFTNCTTVPSLSNTNVFQNINANCQIKVPAELEEEWKDETNWVTYADYIIGV